MLVEINLLPKKEPRDVTPYIIIISIAIIVAILGIIMYSKWTDGKEGLANTKSEIQQVKLQQIAEEKKFVDKSEGNAIQQLQTIVEKTEQQTLHNVDLTKRMVALLPEQGYFKSYKYENGMITLHVLYREYTEAAYYYKRLQEEEWISSVNMSSVDEVKLGKEVQEVFYNGVYEIHMNKEKLKELQKEKAL